jgi:Cu2+-exporting ATPase
VLQMAAAMEQASEHPLAKAIRDGAADKLARQDVDVLVTAHQSITGAGVAAELDGVTYRLGSVLFAADLHSDRVPDAIRALQAVGETIIALANPSGWVAFFHLEDELRESSAGAVAELAPLGIETCIMSGDTVTAAQRIANKVGISKALGGLSPEGKHAALLQLQTSGKVVAMVGDGVNDAPVLAQAQVSIAMGGGTDLARTQADMVLLGEDMSALSDGVRLARRTMRVIRQNLVWAFAYNFLAIPFAMMGWITPWMAGIGMSASSLFVVLNALRLQRA